MPCCKLCNSAVPDLLLYAKGLEDTVLAPIGKAFMWQEELIGVAKTISVCLHEMSR